MNGIFRFTSRPQIVLWHAEAMKEANAKKNPSGPVYVLKQVERNLGLVFEIKPTGRMRLAGPLELDRRKQ